MLMPRKHDETFRSVSVRFCCKYVNIIYSSVNFSKSSNILFPHNVSRDCAVSMFWMIQFCTWVLSRLLTWRPEFPILKEQYEDCCNFVINYDCLVLTSWITQINWNISTFSIYTVIAVNKYSLWRQYRISLSQLLNNMENSKHSTPL